MTNTSFVVCGEKVNIGTRVVLWDEPGGLNAYDTTTKIIKYQDRKMGKIITLTTSGKRYGSRTFFGKVDLLKLKSLVTQFFLHHSGLYTSKETFNVLHNERGLSVHFILNDDGVIYQTLDLREKAWHGGKNNPMSVGIEIDSKAHVNKYPDAYDEYHQKQKGVSPRRKRLDKVNGAWILGYEYNDKQYAALIRLAIGLLQVFPQMNGYPGFPRTASGSIIKEVIPNPLAHKGFICHYNNNEDKNDPISFDHYRFLSGVVFKDPQKVSTFLLFDSWLERQKGLQMLGYNPGALDGIFGPKTESALKVFQKDVGLISDGTWGERTAYVMDLKIKEKK